LKQSQNYLTMTRMFVYLLFAGFLMAARCGYSQEADKRDSASINDKLILQSCDGYLKSAFRYSLAVGCIEMIGGALIGIGTALNNDKDILVGVGVAVGFGGMEMSKTIPVPLTKARRVLDRIQPSWKDSLAFIRLRQNVGTAETLGYLTMVLTFAGQGLAIAGGTSSNENTRTILFASGIVCAVASVGTCFGSAFMTQRARLELGRSFGSIGVGIGPQGIGAVYRLP
jgi:hypothetical protein